MLEKDRVTRKSYLEIRNESLAIWKRYGAVGSFASFEDFHDNEIRHYEESGLIKGTKSNKAVDMIKAINENSKALLEDGVSMKKQADISRNLKALLDSSRAINSMSTSMKKVGRLANYDFLKHSNNWNSTKSIKKATDQGMTDEELLETLTSQVESQEEE
jgi:hypothetical protein